MAYMRCQSGGGVLVISAAQLLVGLCLLGIFEGYKKYWVTNYVTATTSGDATEDMVARISFESPLSYESPMGLLFPLSIFNNIFAICGLFGVMNAQRELIICFFVYNAASMVAAFHIFVDLCTDAGIQYAGEPPKLSAYEKAAAAFLFFAFVLSVSATFFAVRAVDEIKAKQREDYNRIAVLSDTLQFEADSSGAP